MKKLLLIPFFILATCLNAQDYGSIFGTEVANMPIAVTNNAVVGGYANDTAYVYSFGGMDSTKIWSGITNKSFRYNTVTDVWDTIPDLPNTNAVIASAASYVDSVIYIMGGYQVLANGNEISSNIVNRYDPRTNTYLSNGATIPIPIDDHVQAVYKDSLIYIITGWSNTGNVPNVQIYDPANDNWLVGTPVPNNGNYKAFGAAGIIINNTIYYHGGASTGFNFPAQSTLRIGQIDPNNPTQIAWSTQTTNLVSYRAVAIVDIWTNLPAFIGGSETTYNYNGIAYNGTGGVSPKGFSIGPDDLSYTPAYGKTAMQNIYINAQNDSILPIDLRGVAFPFGTPGISNNYIAGGMLRNQQVSNKTFKFLFSHASTVKENKNNLFTMYPNPSNENVNILFKTIEPRKISLINILGKEVLQINTTKQSVKINVSSYPKGNYFIKVVAKKGTSTQKVIIK